MISKNACQKRQVSLSLYCSLCMMIFQALNTQEESQRMTAVRKAYQKAIVTPTHHVEQLWKDYENFENSVSRQLVIFFHLDYACCLSLFCSGVVGVFVCEWESTCTRWIVCVKGLEAFQKLWGLQLQFISSIWEDFFRLFKSIVLLL